MKFVQLGNQRQCLDIGLSGSTGAIYEFGILSNSTVGIFNSAKTFWKREDGDWGFVDSSLTPFRLEVEFE